MHPRPQWKIEDRVVLTAEGAKAHRHYWNGMMLAAGPLMPITISIRSLVPIPEAGCRGVIRKMSRRSFAKGWDYEVFWDYLYKQPGDQFKDGEYHQGCHLIKDLSNEPHPWEWLADDPK